MLGRKELQKRATKVPTRLEERTYYLIQWIQDGIREILADNEIRNEEDGSLSALYKDKHYYPCVILTKNDDKEVLMKAKRSMEGSNSKKKQDSQKKTHQAPNKKQDRKENKKKEVATKNEEKQERKENKKKELAKKNEEKIEKEQKKKEKRMALEERDRNILERMAEVNKSRMTMFNESEICQKEKQLNDKMKEMEAERNRKEGRHVYGIDYDDDDSDSDESLLELEKAKGQKNEMRKRKEEKNRIINDSGFYSDYELEIDELKSKKNNCNYSDSDYEDKGDITADFDVREAANLLNVSANSSIRATVGMKRPRAGLTKPLSPKKNRVSGCIQCQELQIEINELKQANELLTAELNNFKGAKGNPPRPGKVPECMAKKFNMVELCPGQGVFLYTSHLTKATSKTATACARFLLSCFYSNEELKGCNLNGVHGKKQIDATILESIINFTMKRYNLATDSNLKLALRNKISHLDSTAKPPSERKSKQAAAS